MLKTTEYIESLDKMFNPEDKNFRIDLNILKQICSTHDYKRLIDITGILFKLFLTGRQYLSVKELIGPESFIDTHQTGKERRKSENEKIQFFIDELSLAELNGITKEVQVIRKKLRNSIYSIRIKQILDLLKKKIQQVKGTNQKKTEGQSIIVLADYQILDEEYKRLVISTSAIINGTKLSDFLKSPKTFIDGKITNPCILLKYLALEILPVLERNIFSIPINSHLQREGELERTLKFISQYFILQYQIQVQISKNTLVETRIFVNKIFKEILIRNQKMIVKSLARILNEALLSPSNMAIQNLLLRILRRIYLLWDANGANSNPNIQNFIENGGVQENNIVNIVKNPLFLNLRNISLFSQSIEDQGKEAAMLCYKIIQEKNDLELSSMLENCQELKFLKTSKFYSSKAFTYADEIQKIYDIIELGTPFWKFHQHLAAREVWYYNIVVEKPSSLLFWEFHLAGYDVRFGFYKMDQLRQLAIQQYEKGVDCKQIVKMEKVQSAANSPNRGHLYLKNGVYRFVFDNSFSMMRGKDLSYIFLHLQSSI